MPHMIRRAETRKKAHSRLRHSEKEILEPQREVECAAFALVVRKGSNFDPLLCVLSPLFSHRPTMASRVYLLTTRSEANCVSPIRRSRSAYRGPTPEGRVRHPRGSRGRLLGFRAFLKPLRMEANGFGHFLSSWRVGRLGGIPALSMPG
jgi:hypothetical protein